MSVDWKVHKNSRPPNAFFLRKLVLYVVHILVESYTEAYIFTHICISPKLTVLFSRSSYFDK